MPTSLKFPQLRMRFVKIYFLSIQILNLFKISKKNYLNLATLFMRRRINHANCVGFLNLAVKGGGDVLLKAYLGLFLLSFLSQRLLEAQRPKFPLIFGPSVIFSVICFSIYLVLWIRSNAPARIQNMKADWRLIIFNGLFFNSN